MKSEQATELKLDAKDVLQKYIDIAFADITDFVEFGSEEKVEMDDYAKPILVKHGKPITYLANYLKS